MSPTARVARGRATQQLLAAWFRTNGWPYAQAVTGSMNGRDITGMPALAPEVKATSDNPGPAALRQARRNAHRDDVPFTVWRPNGYGLKVIDEWVAMLELGEFTRLLRLAGYGTPLPGQEHELHCAQCGATTRARYTPPPQPPAGEPLWDRGFGADEATR